MKQGTPTAGYSLEQLMCLHDRAHAQVAQLRREAIAEFWRATRQWLSHPRGAAAKPLRCAH